MVTDNGCQNRENGICCGEGFVGSLSKHHVNTPMKYTAVKMTKFICVDCGHSLELTLTSALNLQYVQKETQTIHNI